VVVRPQAARRDRPASQVSNRSIGSRSKLSRHR
jgi:hypothetical protein